MEEEGGQVAAAVDSLCGDDGRVPDEDVVEDGDDSVAEQGTAAAVDGGRAAKE